MSRRIENHCVDCGLPCLGSSCSYLNVPVDYCDDCGNDKAEYRIDNDDFCESCAEKQVQEAFNDFTLLEKAQLVKVNLKRIDN